MSCKYILETVAINMCVSCLIQGSIYQYIHPWNGVISPFLRFNRPTTLDPTRCKACIYNISFIKMCFEQLLSTLSGNVPDCITKLWRLKRNVN